MSATTSPEVVKAWRWWWPFPVCSWGLLLFSLGCWCWGEGDGSRGWKGWEVRGEWRGGPGCRQSLRFSQSNTFSLFIFQMPKVWLRCSWGKDVHTSVLVVVKKTWNFDFMKLLLCWPVKTHVQQSQSTSSSKHCVCILTFREPSCWSKRETPWRLLVGSATLSLF